jgi:hypothetical protein
VAVDACSKSDNTPPVATVTVTPSKTRVALGSPLDLTYRFDVAPDDHSGDYRVFVHFVKPDGQILWSDDHDIPADVPPTSQWKPGQNVQYTMSRFIPSCRTTATPTSKWDCIAKATGCRCRRSKTPTTRS